MKKKAIIKILTFAIAVLTLSCTLSHPNGFYSRTKKPTFTVAHPEESENHIDQKIADIIALIDESLIREYLETLVEIGPRMTGTEGCRKAAEYIYQQFQNYNLDTRYQNWTAIGNAWIPRSYDSQNVEGTLNGFNDSSEAIVIFNAHYDTVDVSPGADDDGSGTAAVLAAAYALSQFDFHHTIKFVTFSGEEVGLLGSKVYAKEAYENNNKILIEFNADMIGHAETKEAGEKFRMYSTEDATWIMDAIKHINRDYDFSFNLINGTVSRRGGGGSDYYSFAQYGFETIAFFEGEWNPHMHTPADDLDNVNFSYLVKTTRLIASILAYVADTTYLQPQIKIATPMRGKLYVEGSVKHTFTYEKTLVIGDILLQVDTYFSNAPITKAEFYYDDRLEYTDMQPPFEWYLDKTSIRTHEVKIIVYDELGRNSTDWIPIFYINL